jgi:hypothetical protein
MVEEGHDHVRAEILDLEIGRPTLQPIGSERTRRTKQLA